MAFTKYVTQFKDKDGNVYGVMDEECRLSKADIIAVSDTTPSPVKTLTDGADGLPMGLTVGIEPVQDLHGQENPWPAGGGKNLLAPFVTSQTYRGVTWTANADGTFTTTGNATEASQIISPDLTLSPGEYVLTGCPSGGSNATYFSRILRYSGSTLLGGATDTGSGATVTITGEETRVFVFFSVDAGTGAPSGVWKPMLCLSSALNPTTFAPYSNVCPITGWTGAEVTRTGKNLLYLTNNNYNNSQYISITGTEGNLTFTSTKGYGRAGYVVQGLKVGETYTISARIAKTATSGAQSTIYLNKEIVWSYAYGVFAIGDAIKEEELYSKPFVAETDVLFIGVYVSAGKGYPDTLTIKDFQLEVGSSVSAYEAYQGETYEIAFPSEAGTVYGGNLTVNADGTGTLVVDRATVTLDGTQNIAENGTLAYGGVQATYTPSPEKKPAPSTLVQNEGLMSDKFDASETSLLTPFGITGRPTNGKVYMNMPAGVTTPAEAKTWFSNNPTQVSYLLATPQVYTLTDLDLVETLKGMNNLWADTGDIKAVDYPADTKLYIDGKVAELQALILENISNS